MTDPVSKPVLGLVSVVIVNYNGAKYMSGLFSSLQRQTHGETETWLFDNGSTDGSADEVERRLPAVQVIRLGGNRGYSVPVNEGIRRARGEYVLVLNTDVVLEPRFVERMIAGLGRYPTAGWAAGRMLKLTDAGPSERIDCLGHHMSRMRYATETDYSRPFRWEDYDQDMFVFGASGCAALYRRSMLADVAPAGECYDEDFFAYFEDVDLDWRAQQRGWKCVYVPDAVGYHVRGGSGLIERADIAAGYLSNRWLMIVKNDIPRHFLRDVVPFTVRLLKDTGFYLRTNPRALPLAITRFLRLLPGAIRKRREIVARRLVSPRVIRAMIR